MKHPKENTNATASSFIEKFFHTKPLMHVFFVAVALSVTYMLGIQSLLSSALSTYIPEDDSQWLSVVFCGTLGDMFKHRQEERDTKKKTYNTSAGSQQQERQVSDLDKQLEAARRNFKDLATKSLTGGKGGPILSQS